MDAPMLLALMLVFAVVFHAARTAGLAVMRWLDHPAAVRRLGGL